MDFWMRACTCSVTLERNANFWYCSTKFVSRTNVSRNANCRTTNFFARFRKSSALFRLRFLLAVFRPRINEEQFQEPKCRKSGELLQLTTTVVGKVKFLYSPADKYRIYSRYSSRAVATYHAECHDVKHELPTQRWLPWRQRIFVFILPWVSKYFKG